MCSVTLVLLRTGQWLSQIFLDLGLSAFLCDEPQVAGFWKEHGRGDDAVPREPQKDVMSPCPFVGSVRIDHWANASLETCP